MHTKYIVAVVTVLFFSTINADADDTYRALFGDKLSAKDSFKYSKCNNAPTGLSAQLTYDELCRYGTGCPAVKKQTKYDSYCSRENLSQCFEDKAWQSANEVVGLSPEIKIGLFSQDIAINKGVVSGKSCAYYN